MWKVAVTLLFLSKTILGASIVTCPDGATCHEKGAIESSSFNFFKKMGPKHYQTVTKLVVTNASLDKVPAELKYLKRLEYLDLSNNNIQVSSIPSLPHLKVLKLGKNNIKGISLSLLPKGIEDLDLSSNLLSQIPRDWSSLQSLKILHLHKNLIDCDCYSNNILIYEKLIKAEIKIPEPITCFVPKHFADKSIGSIHCPAEDEMINDQYDEGSGEDIFRETTPKSVLILDEKDDMDENEVIDDRSELPKETKSLIVTNIVTTEATLNEGSGDLEGSGFPPVEIEHISACNFNCKTLGPVRVHDNDTAPQPGPSDQIKIITEDVFDPIFAKPLPSTSTTIKPTTDLSDTTPYLKAVEFSEANIKKEISLDVFKESDKDTDTDVFLNDTRTGEMEKATALNQNNYAVYVVVACGLMLAVVFLVCLIKKRKSKRINKNRRDIPSNYGEEMKSLEKPFIQPVNEKNGKTLNNISEHISLLNREKSEAQDSAFKSYTPLEHSESFGEHIQDRDFEEPELRHKPGELLTPTRERVTIRASEIADSLPKTPVLVHRQKNSDGEIVTTVVPP